MPKGKSKVKDNEENTENVIEENEVKETSSFPEFNENELNNAVKEVNENTNEANEAVIQNQAKKEEVIQQEAKILKDSQGRSFDPNLHKVDPGGQPILTSKGNLSLKPGRKQGSTVGTINQVQQNQPDERYKGSAKSAVAIFQALNVSFGGPKYKMEPEEKFEIENATEKYFATKDIRDIPPGYLFAMAIGGYYLARIDLNKTKTITGSIWEKIKSKFSKEKKQNAQPDSGNDGLREVYTGEAVSNSV